MIFLYMLVHVIQMKHHFQLQSLFGLGNNLSKVKILYCAVDDYGFAENSLFRNIDD